jgi:hypothetical protein
VHPLVLEQFREFNGKGYQELELEFCEVLGIILGKNRYDLGHIESRGRAISGVIAGKAFATSTSETNSNGGEAWE